MLKFGIALCLFISALFAIGQAPTPPPLEGTSWVMSELDGKPFPAGMRAPTLKFNPERKSAGGKSTVNTYGSAYTLAKDALKFSQIVSTKMAGPPEAMEAERRFFEVLSRTDRFRIVDRELQLLNGRQVLAKFRSSKPE